MKAYRLNLDAKICDYDGEAIRIPMKNATQITDVEDATLKRVLMMALATPAKARQNAEMILDDQELARRIRTGGNQEFGEAEIKILREQVVYRFMDMSQVPQGEMAAAALELIDAGKQAKEAPVKAA